MKPGSGAPERLACLVVAHNLGDAVIQSGFLKEQAGCGYAERYLVWTRPQVAFLFADIANCDVVCSQFPIGTSKQMGGTAIFAFLKAAWQVRQRRPSVTIDLIGDVRDRFFAHLAGTPRHLHIGWAEGHPFKRLIRNPWGAGKPFAVVPAEVRNVYAGHDLMLDKLVAGNGSVSGARRSSVLPGHNREAPLRVGLHPFASQPFRLWPAENWRQLVRDLLNRDAEVCAFGAPAELVKLQSLFGEFGTRVRLIADTIPGFAKHTALLDVMVGLDSFSVHMAERQGTRSIMINAGQPPDLWAPPHGKSVASSGGCAHYPCYNVPVCLGTDFESACVRSITVVEVSRAVLG